MYLGIWISHIPFAPQHHPQRGSLYPRHLEGVEAEPLINLANWISSYLCIEETKHPLEKQYADPCVETTSLHSRESTSLSLKPVLSKCSLTHELAYCIYSTLDYLLSTYYVSSLELH